VLSRCQGRGPTAELTSILRTWASAASTRSRWWRPLWTVYRTSLALYRRPLVGTDACIGNAEQLLLVSGSVA